jgi:hypothetical protein
MLKITIKTDNEAFADGNADHEIARILRKLADHIEGQIYTETLMDFNGNKVGTVKY